jgi:hypothetical protein
MDVTMNLLRVSAISAALFSIGAMAQLPSKALDDFLNQTPKKLPRAAPPSQPTSETPTTSSPAPRASGKSSTNSRFTIYSDGAEVIDSKTSLVWRRCLEGMTWGGNGCTGQPIEFKAAMRVQDHAKRQTPVASRWRVPTLDELKSIVPIPTNETIRLGVSTAIDATAFPNMPNAPLWSSTWYYPDRGDRDRTKVVFVTVADGVNMSSEAYRDNGESGLARLVRPATLAD